MKAGTQVSTACRLENGSITVISDTFVSVRKKHRILNIPLLRGVINFVEMMKLSMRTLNASAAAMGLEEAEESRFSKFLKKHMGIRLTDVMLMRAEALAYMGGEENCREAFDLVTAVNARACGGASELQYDESQIKTLVLDERQRELMFEGKRWYDLVRMVRHSDNPTQTMSVLRNTYLLRRYKSNGNDAVARLGSLDNLFLPIYQNEIDVNPMLADDQNQAYVY